MIGDSLAGDERQPDALRFLHFWHHKPQLSQSKLWPETPHCAFVQETSCDTDLCQIPRVLQTFPFEHQQLCVSWVLPTDLFGHLEGFFEFLTLDE